MTISVVELATAAIQRLEMYAANRDSVAISDYCNEACTVIDNLSAALITLDNTKREEWLSKQLYLILHDIATDVINSLNDLAIKTRNPVPIARLHDQLRVARHLSAMCANRSTEPAGIETVRSVLATPEHRL